MKNFPPFPLKSIQSCLVPFLCSTVLPVWRCFPFKVLVYSCQEVTISNMRLVVGGHGPSYSQNTLLSSNHETRLNPFSKTMEVSPRNGRMRSALQRLKPDSPTKYMRCLFRSLSTSLAQEHENTRASLLEQWELQADQ